MQAGQQTESYQQLESQVTAKIGAAPRRVQLLLASFPVPSLVTVALEVGLEEGSVILREVPCGLKQLLALPGSVAVDLEAGWVEMQEDVSVAENAPAAPVAAAQSVAAEFCSCGHVDDVTAKAFLYVVFNQLARFLQRRGFKISNRNWETSSYSQVARFRSY